MGRKKGRVVYRGEQPSLGKIDISEDEFSEMIAKRVSRLREERGAMQATLGDALGVGYSSISRIESGDMQVSAYRALALAQAFGVPVEELLKIEEDTEETNND